MAKSAFYGEWEIISSSKTERGGIEGFLLNFAPQKLNNGKDIVPSSLFVPEHNYSNVVTSEPLDWTTHREQRLAGAIKEVISVLKKYNMFIGTGEGISPDFPYICDQVAYSLSSQRKQVHDHYFGSPAYAQTIIELDEHLKKITKE